MQTTEYLNKTLRLENGSTVTVTLLNRWMWDAENRVIVDTGEKIEGFIYDGKEWRHLSGMEEVKVKGKGRKNKQYKGMDCGLGAFICEDDRLMLDANYSGTLKVVEPTKEETGDYPFKTFYAKGCHDAKVNAQIHRLVAEAFVINPNPKKFKLVNHIVSVTKDVAIAHYTNLNWTDNSGNMNAEAIAKQKETEEIELALYAKEPIWKPNESWVLVGKGTKRCRNGNHKWVSNQGRQAEGTATEPLVIVPYGPKPNSNERRKVNIQGKSIFISWLVAMYFNEDGTPMKTPLTIAQQRDLSANGYQVDHISRENEGWNNQATNLRIIHNNDNQLNKGNNTSLVICIDGTNEFVAEFPNSIEADAYVGVLTLKGTIPKGGGGSLIISVANPNATTKRFLGSKNGLEGIILTAYRSEDYYKMFPKQELYPIEEGKNGQLTFVI